MYKIVLISGDSTLTGVPFHVLRLAKGLLRKGFGVILIAPPGKLIELARKEKISTTEIAMKGPLDWGAVRNIERELRRLKPDIVHTHGMRGGWLGRLASRNIKCKKVYTEHLWTPTFHLKNRAYEIFQLRGLKFMDRYTDCTIAVSKSVSDFLINNLGFNKEKIHIIPNGINPRFLKAKLLKKPKDSPIVIGSVGSLNNSKNHQVSIKAIAKVIKNNPDLNLHLQIIGEGPTRKSLEALAKREGIEDRVHLVGKVKDIMDRFQHFSIYLNCSLSETFGLAVGEAMALGLPVIASDIAALRYLVGDAGILVDAKDPDKIAEKVSLLIKDKKLGKKLGEKAKKRIRDHFSEEIMLDKIIKLYKFLLN